MTQLRSTYHSRIYEDFRAIEATDWRTIVRFFEEQEKAIQKMEFQEHFELLLAYATALFELGNYEKHLLMADTVVEVSVMNNIKFFNGIDVFRSTLFKKAASLFHLERLNDAEYILRELIRIDPYDVSTSMFLKKCLRHMHPPFLKQARAVSIFLFLLSALLICIEMLFIRSFYPEYGKLMESIRNGVFLIGVIILVGSDVLHRWRVIRNVDRFIQRIRRVKNK